MGIISGALQGLSEGAMKGMDFYMKSMLQEQAEKAMMSRDERLAALRESADVRAEDRKREPYKQAAAAAEELVGSAVADRNPVAVDDNGNAMPRAPLAPGEEQRIRAGAYERAGLPEVASTMRQEGMRAEESDKDRLFRSEESEKTRSSQEKLATMTNERIKEEGRLTREQQLQLHKERMSEMQAQFRNAGLSVQSTQDGIAVVDAKNKSVTLLKGPDGKPLKTMRDEDSLKMLGALGSLAKAATDAGDMDSAKLYLGIAGSMINKKTGGENKPSEADLAKLRANSGNPAYAKAFEEKFGVPASTYLSQGGAKSGTTSSTASVDKSPRRRADIEQQMASLSTLSDSEQHPEIPEKDREAMRSKLRTLGDELASIINAGR